MGARALGLASSSWGCSFIRDFDEFDVDDGGTGGRDAAGDGGPDAGHDGGRDAGRDGGTDGRPDGGRDGAPDACATAEQCNGRDDACDGATDEGAADACSVDNGTTDCVGGTCRVASCGRA